MDMVGRVDSSIAKLSKKVDAHAKDWLKFASAAGAASVAVFEFARRTNDAIDQLGKMSQKVGVSVEALSSLKYAAELSDVSLDQLGQGLKQLSKFMVESGVSGVSVEEQLLKIAEEFSRTNDGAAKTAAAMKYFGKAGADLIPFLNQGREGIEALREEAARLGIVFSTDAAKRAEEFNDNLTRLKSAAQALQVELSGPLVEALNKTAGAMLQAQRNGEGFFRAIIEGFRTLVTGDDLDKWNREFVEATDRMVAAENNVLRLSNLGGNAAARGLKKAREELAAAKADIERLQAIKPVLFGAEGEPVSGMDHPSTRRIFQGDPNVPGDDAAKRDRDAELIGKQLQEAADEEVRIQSEASQLISDQRAKERAEVLESQRLFHELGLAGDEEFTLEQLRQMKAAQDERLKMLMEAYDREEQLAIEHGAEIIAVERSTTELKKREQEAQMANAQSFLSNLAGLMNTNSRKVFEIGKAASLAQAAVKGSLAVMDAWEAGMSVGGPWAPLVAAAYAAAAAANAVNLMNNIRKQSFGGGGGAPTPPGQGASGVGTPGGDMGGGSGQGRARGPDTFITLGAGDMYSRESVRKLLKRFEEEGRDGGRIVVVEE